MKINEFQLTLTNCDNEVLDVKHIAVIEDWMDVPEDFNNDLEYDHVFDFSEIRDYANADRIAPDIEEAICQVLERHIPKKA